MLLVCLLGYAGYQLHFLLFEASYFKLRSIEVEGLQTLSEEEVLRYSGLSLGQLAFTVDHAEVARRIEMAPKVAACQVTRSGPNGLKVVLEERPEVARAVVEGRIHEVGADGQIMGEAAPDSRAPLLLDAEVVDGPPRRLAERHQARLAQWLPVLARPPTTSFTRIRFGGGGRLDVMWRGIRLVVDDPARFERHRPFLGPVLAHARALGKGFDYVDLRFEDVVVRFQDLAPTPVAALPAARTVAAEVGNQENGAVISDLDRFMLRAAQPYQGEGEPPAFAPAAPVGAAPPQLAQAGGR